MKKKASVVPERLPVIPVIPPDVVVFPGMPVYVKLPLDEDAQSRMEKIGYLILLNRPLKLDDPERKHVGLVCRIAEIIPAPPSMKAIILEGLYRCKIRSAANLRPEKMIHGEETAEWSKFDEVPIDEQAWENPDFAAKIAELKAAIEEILEILSASPYFTDEVVLFYEEAIFLLNTRQKNGFSSALDKMAVIFNAALDLFSIEFLYDLFEDAFVVSRFEKSLDLARQFSGKLKSRAAETKGGGSMSRGGRRQEEQDPNVKKYEEIKPRLTEEAKKTIEQSISRLQRFHPDSADASVTQTYLDWLLNYPWGVYTKDNDNITDAREILNEDHYGLVEQKERIIEFLASRKLNPKMKSPILLFVGPPGVGKTSLGKSIARALGRKFIRISMSGTKDEADIRGHRRTYVGALPGKIIQFISLCGSSNPVFMIDEVDKIPPGSSISGDPAAALIEVQDPEQNHNFVDHYFSIGVDLSQVFFINTANTLDGIFHPAFLDRSEVIEFPSYTEDEKAHIANEFLIPKQLKEHGLDSASSIFKKDGSEGYEPVDIVITEPGLTVTITDYTREAGVRELERKIAQIYRKIAKRVTESGSTTQPKEEREGVAPSDTNRWEINEKNLNCYLNEDDKETVSRHMLKDNLKPGIAPMVGVTQAGGMIINIHTSYRKDVDHRKIKVTYVDPHNQQVGKMIEESADIAWDYLFNDGGLLSDLGIPENTYLHISVSNGGMPKDGTSAGIALLWALYGLFTGQSLKSGLTGTGEITLAGEVGEVGAIVEKVIGAARDGARETVIPLANGKDIKKIPEKTREKIKIIPCDSMDKVLKIGFPNCPIIRRKLAHIQID